MHKAININYMIVLSLVEGKKYRIEKGIEGDYNFVMFCFKEQNKLNQNMATFIKASWCVKRY